MPVNEVSKEVKTNFGKRENIISHQGFECEHWTEERIRQLLECPERVRHKLIHAHVIMCHGDQ